MLPPSQSPGRSGGGAAASAERHWSVKPADLVKLANQTSPRPTQPSRAPWATALPRSAASPAPIAASFQERDRHAAQLPMAQPAVREDGWPAVRRAVRQLLSADFKQVRMELSFAMLPSDRAAPPSPPPPLAPAAGSRSPARSQAPHAAAAALQAPPTRSQPLLLQASQLQAELDAWLVLGGTVLGTGAFTGGSEQWQAERARALERACRAAAVMPCARRPAHCPPACVQLQAGCNSRLFSTRAIAPPACCRRPAGAHAARTPPAHAQRGVPAAPVRCGAAHGPGLGRPAHAGTRRACAVCHLPRAAGVGRGRRCVHRSRHRGRLRWEEAGAALLHPVALPRLRCAHPAG